MRVCTVKPKPYALPLRPRVKHSAGVLPASGHAGSGLWIHSHCAVRNVYSGRGSGAVCGGTRRRRSKGEGAGAGGAGQGTLWGDCMTIMRGARSAEPEGE